jgi:signal transduction histidine kinase
MSLRSKLLALFSAFAVVPLVAVAAYGYVQSLRALEALLVRQTAAVADEISSGLARAAARRESFALLLTENAETQSLYRKTGTSPEDSVLAKADTFLTDAWRRFGSEYRSLQLRDTLGRVVFGIGDRAPNAAGIPAGSFPIERDIRDSDSGVRRGTLMLAAALDAVFPTQLVERHVGDRGYSVVIDRRTGQILFHPRAALVGQSIHRLTDGLPYADSSRLASPTGWFRSGKADSARIVSYANLESPALTIFSVASLAEFAPPFEHARSVQLTTVLALTAVIAIAFAHLLRGATRSLEDLTLAADAVGRGNLSPVLPRADGDEVGRLARAFETMVRRVRDMITQVESSRQMAVVGEFASQIAHEIRNPLTSIKLNLQGLARDARLGRVPPDSAAAVDICLLEIERLDGVVGGVLTLAQITPTHVARASGHAIVRDALRVVAAQASASEVEIETAFRAADDAVECDATRLHAALLNLFLNALAAMPNGGTLRISTETQLGVDNRRLFQLRIADTGPGVAADDRERIFRPFHTTRAQGTGLGLPIARRTIDAHGGRLLLEDAPPGTVGASFLIELPLTSEPA